MSAMRPNISSSMYCVPHFARLVSLHDTKISSLYFPNKDYVTAKIVPVWIACSSLSLQPNERRVAHVEHSGDQRVVSRDGGRKTNVVHSLLALADPGRRGVDPHLWPNNSSTGPETLCRGGSRIPCRSGRQPSRKGRQPTILPNFQQKQHEIE